MKSSILWHMQVGFHFLSHIVTELETLAVMWAVQHFRAYLYGYAITVIIDHSAVKSILDKPSSNGKHAQWWLKISGSRFGQLKIIYHKHESGGTNALSHNPVFDDPNRISLNEIVL